MAIINARKIKENKILRAIILSTSVIILVIVSLELMGFISVGKMGNRIIVALLSAFMIYTSWGRNKKEQFSDKNEP